MSSYFFCTEEVVSETSLPSTTTHEKAIALIHDHAKFSMLQPITTETSTTPAPPPTDWLFQEATCICPPNHTIEYRSVTIAVPFGPFTSSMACPSAVIDTEDGIIIVFRAPMGLSFGSNRYRVVEDEKGDGLVLREEARVTGVWGMMGFIMGQEKENHRVHRERFAEALRNGS